MQLDSKRVTATQSSDKRRNLGRGGVDRGQTRGRTLIDVAVLSLYSSTGMVPFNGVTGFNTSVETAPVVAHVMPKYPAPP